MCLWMVKRCCAAWIGAQFEVMIQPFLWLGLSQPSHYPKKVNKYPFCFHVKKIPKQPLSGVEICTIQPKGYKLVSMNLCIDCKGRDRTLPCLGQHRPLQRKKEGGHFPHSAIFLISLFLFFLYYFCVVFWMTVISNCRKKMYKEQEGVGFKPTSLREWSSVNTDLGLQKKCFEWGFWRNSCFTVVFTAPHRPPIAKFSISHYPFLTGHEWRGIK